MSDRIDRAFQRLLFIFIGFLFGGVVINQSKPLFGVILFLLLLALRGLVLMFVEVYSKERRQK